MVRKTIIFVFVFLFSLEAVLRLSGKIYYYIQTPQVDPNSFRIMALGESTTQGSAAFGKQFSYPGQLELLLSRTCKRQVQVINLGMAGIRSKDILASLPANIAKYHPNIAITMIGINDSDGDSRYIDSAAQSPFIQNFIKNTQLFKLQTWIRKSLREMRAEKNLGGIQPLDTPEDILGKIKAGNDLDEAAFGTHFSEVLFNAGDLDRAVRLHEEVLKVKPKHGWANAGLGWIYLKLKHDNVQAEKYYRAALLADRTDKDALIWFKLRLAQLFAETKQQENFTKIVNEILESGKANSFTYTFLADLYIQSGNWNKALELLRRGNEEYPYDQKISALLIHGYSRTNDLDLYHSQIKKHESMLTQVSFETYINYRAIIETLLDKKISVVAMQYPLRNAENIRNTLRDFAENPELQIVENLENFSDALKTQRYDELFIDRFGGDFGHTTMKGDELLAGNAAKALLEKFPSLKTWCESN
jgi:tetratricopeptide (TPR) repeat protein